MVTTTAEAISLKLQVSLDDTPYACSALQSLSGGTVNFVYRGTLQKPLEDGTQAIIIKHSEPYVALHPASKLTTDRCDFEKSILDATSSFLTPSAHANISIRTPHIYTIPATTTTTLPNTQIHEDLPSSADLKTYLIAHTLTRAQCDQLGHALGLWTKRFHVWTAAPEQHSLRETMKGNKAMRELKYQINYAMLVATVANFPEILGESKRLLEEVAGKVREEMDGADGERFLIHGDFWTGNVLIPNSPFPTSSTTDPLTLFVIDWELSHLASTLSYDLGQMFAELYELTHFKSIDAGKWVIEAFMRGYGKIEDNLACRVAVHVGTHFICFGSRVAGWGSEEQVRGVVKAGRDLVDMGWRRDVDGLRRGGWGCLFE